MTDRPFARPPAARKGRRTRILVVDDSVVVRQLLARTLGEEPDFEIAGTAANGSIALARIPQVNPDVITLDVEMPELDGIETLKLIRKQYPEVRVIMFASQTERGARITLDALMAGADDYVTKPSSARLAEATSRLKEELVPKIRQFGISVEPAPAGIARAPQTLGESARQLCSKPSLLVIGASTGGPAALGTVLGGLPANFPLPVLIVQHMPPLFTGLLAQRLNTSCALEVGEAVEGAPVEAGKAWVAPGDYHMRLQRKGVLFTVTLDQSTPQNSCRPAVDPLFESAAAAGVGQVIVVVLTGMGQDGFRGSELLKNAGAYVVCQDEATSVVWGMPGKVASAGLADAVLPVDRIATHLLSKIDGSFRSVIA
jgi:two-component system, chemotaxis family, protein-glutamate methylesterase/glutaminase